MTNRTHFVSLCKEPRFLMYSNQQMVGLKIFLWCELMQRDKVNFCHIYLVSETAYAVWNLKFYIGKKESFSCAWMACSLPGSSVHGIFRARIMEWVDTPFSSRSSWPRDWTPVSCIAVRFFTIWAIRETFM